MHRNLFLSMVGTAVVFVMDVNMYNLGVGVGGKWCMYGLDSTNCISDEVYGPESF